MESTKLSKRQFAEIVSTYMEKWIEPLREHSRVHFNEWYENEVVYTMFVNWYNAKTEARSYAVNRYLGSTDNDCGKYARERAAQYSEVIHGVLLSKVSTEADKPADSK